MKRKTYLVGVLVALAAPTSAHAQGAPPPAALFEKVTLNSFPGEPVNLAVLPDGRVLHAARTGEVGMHNPRTGLNSLAGTIPVYQHDEEGLQHIAIDPNFERNRWVYVYYSPPLKTPADNPATPAINEGDAPEFGTAADFRRFRGHLTLSRMKFKGDKLNLKSEQKIIDVPVDRGMCCHVGGNIDFDADGNLYLSTGDDTNPFSSDGYTAIDETPGRNPVFDARRTSGNTNDLRGKILRIRPKRGGGYTIPPGNLFREGRAKTKPEIYVMGLRNPYRFAVNRTTGHLYLGDYSPDANYADPLRGPAGHGRWMLVKKAANYGWPYCVTPKLPYIDYNFATKTSGEAFNCAAPRNDSPYNTGLETVPAVARPDVWYSYSQSPHFPGLEPEGPEGNGGIGPMGGPAYEPERGNTSVFRFPRYFEGKPLFYEWTRDYIKEFRLNANERRVTGMFTLAAFVDNPIDLEFGPDGALYVLEYGDGYFAENPDAQLSKINYVRKNRTPEVKAAGVPAGGRAPLTVAFSTAGTVDPENDSLSFAWDFDGDGKVDSRAANPTHTFTANGTYRPTVKVTDKTKRSASAEAPVLVGNQPPVIEFVKPKGDQPFKFGDTISYELKVTDDTPVDCSKVVVTYVLGHEQHGHPQSSTVGCSGSITTALDSGHAGASNLSAVIGASYTDPGEGGAPGLLGTAQRRFEPPSAP